MNICYAFEPSAVENKFALVIVDFAVYQKGTIPFGQRAGHGRATKYMFADAIILLPHSYA